MRRQTVQCIITEIIHQYTTVSNKGEEHIWAWIIIMCYKNQLSTPCVYNIHVMVQWTALDVVYRSYFTICQYSFRAILHGLYKWPLQDGTKTLSMAIFSNHWKVLCELSKSLEVVAISSSMFGSHWKLGWYRCKNLMYFTHTVSLWGWSVFLSNHIHTCKDINNTKTTVTIG